MTRRDLAKRLERQFSGITGTDARELLDLFLDAMKAGLRSGDTVEIQIVEDQEVPVSSGAGDRLGKAVLEKVPVGEIRQGVEVGATDHFEEKIPFFRDVMEDDHASSCLAFAVPDRGHRIFDGITGPGAMEKGGVVRPLHRASLANASVRGDLFRIAREFVLEAEHPGQRLVGRFRKRPAGQVLRHHVHVLHPAVGIRDDDGFSRGTRKIREKSQGFFLSFFSGIFRKAFPCP